MPINKKVFIPVITEKNTKDVLGKTDSQYFGFDPADAIHTVDGQKIGGKAADAYDGYFVAGKGLFGNDELTAGYSDVNFKFTHASAIRFSEIAFTKSNSTTFHKLALTKEGPFPSTLTTINAIFLEWENNVTDFSWSDMISRSRIDTGSFWSMLIKPSYDDAMTDSFWSTLINEVKDNSTTDSFWSTLINEVKDNSTTNSFWSTLINEVKDNSTTNSFWSSLIKAAKDDSTTDSFWSALINAAKDDSTTDSFWSTLINEAKNNSITEDFWSDLIAKLKNKDREKADFWSDLIAKLKDKNNEKADFWSNLVGRLTNRKNEKDECWPSLVEGLRNRRNERNSFWEKLINRIKSAKNETEIETELIVDDDMNVDIIPPENIEDGVKSLAEEADDVFNQIMDGEWTESAGNGYITIDDDFIKLIEKYKKIINRIMAIMLVAEAAHRETMTMLTLVKGYDASASDVQQASETVAEMFKVMFQGLTVFYQELVDFVEKHNEANYKRLLEKAKRRARRRSWWQRIWHPVADFFTGGKYTQRWENERYTNMKVNIDKQFADVKKSIADVFIKWILYLIQQKKKHNSGDSLEQSIVDREIANYERFTAPDALWVEAGDNGYGDSYYDVNKNLVYATMQIQTNLNNLRQAYYTAKQAKARLVNDMLELILGIKNKNNGFQIAMNMVKRDFRFEKQMLMTNVNLQMNAIAAYNQYIYAIAEEEKADAMLTSCVIGGVLSVLTLGAAGFLIGGLMTSMTDWITLEYFVEEDNFQPVKFDLEDVEKLMLAFGMTLKSKGDTIFDQIEQAYQELFEELYNAQSDPGNPIYADAGNGYITLDYGRINELEDKMEALNSLRRAILMVEKSKQKLVSIVLFAATGLAEPDDLSGVNDFFEDQIANEKLGLSMVKDTLEKIKQAENIRNQLKLEREQAFDAFTTGAVFTIVAIVIVAATVGTAAPIAAGLFVVGMAALGNALGNYLFLKDTEPPETVHSDLDFYNVAEDIASGGTNRKTIDDIYKDLIDQMNDLDYIDAGDDKRAINPAEILRLQTLLLSLYFLQLIQMMVEASKKNMRDQIMALMGILSSSNPYDELSGSASGAYQRYSDALNFKIQMVTENIQAYNMHVDWEENMSNTETQLIISSIGCVLSFMSMLSAPGSTIAKILNIASGATAVANAAFQAYWAYTDANSGFGDIDPTKDIMLIWVREQMQNLDKNDPYYNLLMQQYQAIEKMINNLTVSVGNGYFSANTALFFQLQQVVEFAYNAAIALQTIATSKSKTMKQMIALSGISPVGSSDFTMEGLYAAKSSASQNLSAVYDFATAIADRANDMNDARRRMYVAMVTLIVACIALGIRMADFDLAKALKNLSKLPDGKMTDQACAFVAYALLSGGMSSLLGEGWFQLTKEGSMKSELDQVKAEIDAQHRAPEKTSDSGVNALKALSEATYQAGLSSAYLDMQAVQNQYSDQIQKAIEQALTSILFDFLKDEYSKLPEVKSTLPVADEETDTQKKDTAAGNEVTVESKPGAMSSMLSKTWDLTKEFLNSGALGMIMSAMSERTAENTVKANIDVSSSDPKAVGQMSKALAQYPKMAELLVPGTVLKTTSEAKPYYVMEGDKPTIYLSANASPKNIAAEIWHAFSDVNNLQSSKEFQAFLQNESEISTTVLGINSETKSAVDLEIIKANVNQEDVDSLTSSLMLEESAEEISSNIATNGKVEDKGSSKTKEFINYIKEIMGDTENVKPSAAEMRDSYPTLKLFDDVKNNIVKNHISLDDPSAAARILASQDKTLAVQTMAVLKLSSMESQIEALMEEYAQVTASDKTSLKKEVTSQIDTLIKSVEHGLTEAVPLKQSPVMVSTFTESELKDLKPIMDNLFIKYVAESVNDKTIEMKAVQNAEQKTAEVMPAAAAPVAEQAVMDKSTPSTEISRSANVSVSNANVTEQVFTVAEMSLAEIEIEGALPANTASKEMEVLKEAVAIKNKAQIVEETSAQAKDPVEQLQSMQKPLAQMVMKMAALAPEEKKAELVKLAGEIKADASFATPEQAAKVLVQVKEAVAVIKASPKVKELMEAKITEAVGSVEASKTNIGNTQTAQQVVARAAVTATTAQEIVQLITSKPAQAEKIIAMLPAVMAESKEMTKEAKLETIEKIVAALEEIKTNSPSVQVTAAVDKAAQSLTATTIENTQAKSPVMQPITVEIEQSMFIPAETSKEVVATKEQVVTDKTVKAAQDTAVKTMPVSAVPVAEQVVMDRSSTSTEISRSANVSVSNAAVNESYSPAETAQVEIQIGNLSLSAKPETAIMQLIKNVLGIRNKAESTVTVSSEAKDPVEQLKAMEKPVKQLVQQIKDLTPKAKSEEIDKLVQDMKDKPVDFSKPEAVAKVLADIQKAVVNIKASSEVKTLIAAKIMEAVGSIETSETNIGNTQTAQQAVAKAAVTATTVQEIVQLIMSKPAQAEKIIAMLPAVMAENKEIKKEDRQKVIDKIVEAFEEIKASPSFTEPVKDAAAAAANALSNTVHQNVSNVMSQPVPIEIEQSIQFVHTDNIKETEKVKKEQVVSDDAVVTAQETAAKVMPAAAAAPQAAQVVQEKFTQSTEISRSANVSVSNAAVNESYSPAETAQVEIQIGNLSLSAKPETAIMQLIKNVLGIRNKAESTVTVSSEAKDPVEQLKAMEKPVKQLVQQIKDLTPKAKSEEIDKLVQDMKDKPVDFSKPEAVAKVLADIQKAVVNIKASSEVKTLIASKIMEAVGSIETSETNIGNMQTAQQVAAKAAITATTAQEIVQLIMSKPAMAEKIIAMLPAVMAESKEMTKEAKLETIEKIVAALEEIKSGSSGLKVDAEVVDKAKEEIGKVLPASVVPQTQYANSAGVDQQAPVGRLSPSVSAGAQAVEVLTGTEIAEIKQDVQFNNCAGKDSDVYKLAWAVFKRSQKAQEVSAQAKEPVEQLKSLQQPIKELASIIVNRLDKQQSKDKAQKLLVEVQKAQFTDPEEAAKILPELRKLIVEANIDRNVKQAVLQKIDGAITEIAKTVENMQAKELAQKVAQKLSNGTTNQEIEDILNSKPGLTDKAVRMLPSILEGNKQIKADARSRLAEALKQIAASTTDASIRSAVDSTIALLAKQSPVQYGKQAAKPELVSYPSVNINIEEVNLDLVSKVSAEKSGKVALTEIINNRMDPKQAAKYLENFSSDVTAYVLSALQEKDAIAVLSEMQAIYSIDVLKTVVSRVDKSKADRKLLDKIKSIEDAEGLVAVLKSGFEPDQEKDGSSNGGNGNGNGKQKYSIADKQKELIDKHLHNGSVS